MKTVTLYVMLFFSSFLSAQQLSEQFFTIIKNDDAAALEKVLTKDNINTCYEFKNSAYTLLSISIKANSTACFDLLLKKGVDPEINCKGKTPLMYTAKYGKLDFAKKLIAHGASLTSKNERGRTALDYAKKYKQKALIDYFSSL